MGNSLYRLLTGSMRSTMSKFMLKTGFKCGRMIGYSLQLLVSCFVSQRGFTSSRI